MNNQLYLKYPFSLVTSLILLSLLASSVLAATGITTRVSVASDGTQGNWGSGIPSISADGRYVAFLSAASTLVSGDTNGYQDVFVHDRQTGQTTRVSMASDSAQGNHDSFSPSISADGRYVAFDSFASNLVSGDTNGTYDIFFHDLQTGQTTRVSVASEGTQGNSASYNPSISADGRFVTFESGASNLVSGDTNGYQDVFVHDCQTGQTTRVSVASDGAQGNWGSSIPSISADGRIVAFGSDASNLVNSDTNGSSDVFVHDRQTGQTTRISVASDGTQGNQHSNFSSTTSADGRYVAFQSYASNLVSGDTNGMFDIFVHDLQTGQTTRVSVASEGTQGNSASYNPSISADGRFVSFDSFASNLVSGDTNSTNDVFVHDRQTGQTTRVSVASDGTQGNDGSDVPSISADGRYVAFDSVASNLVSGDTNGYADVFVHDLTGTTVDCSTATAAQPVFLVTGWDGSVNKFLSNDENLNLLYSELQNKHYIEGCNLFYAKNTDPSKWQYENAKIIQDDLCEASQTVHLLYPNWTGSFDIIAHSYGGLRARAYLENPDLYGKCTINNQSPEVRNLITLGTPHKGGMPNLPLSFMIGLDSILHPNENTPALIELLPTLRKTYNISLPQPEKVEYYLISGDSRTQVVPPPLLFFSDQFKDYKIEANDMAVHQDSGHLLGLSSFRYSRSTRISTNDVHGRANIMEVSGLNQMKSYFDPSDTFDNYIWPIITGTYTKTTVQSTISQENITGASNSVMNWVSQLADPTPTVNLAQTDIASGVLTGTQNETGSFEITSSGETTVLLVWDAGNVSLLLKDPMGTVIPQDDNYLNFNGGFGWITSYRLPNPQVGTWSYTISSLALVKPTVYRMALLPATPITVVGSLPEWLPNNEPVTITALVSYDNSTPVTGGTVSVRIQRPDSTSEAISLFDDGNHQDGAADDGLFGGSYDNTSLGGVYGVLITATGSYNSEAYTRTATGNFSIAPATASLGMGYSDQGIDDGQDGIYEWLEVSTPVTVTQDGQYMISGELYAGSIFIGQAIVEEALSPGPQHLILRFAGTVISEKKMDGPYTLRNLMLFDESQPAVLIQVVDNVYTTGPYQYLLFTHGAISGNTGVAGVTLSYTDGGSKSATSSSDGSYAFPVSHNWSGTVTPSKIGYTFTPTSRDYVDVQAELSNQDYSATEISPTFTDVPTDYWSWGYIERLYAAGITGGCGSSPLIYCPEATVTRGQMAVFLERGMNSSSYSPPPATGTVFGDIPVSYWSASWVEKLYADGVTGGCGGGNYCPEASVTRAQMAVFLQRAKHGSSYSPPPATGAFGDVPTSYWAASWIEQLTAEGITTGCGGGNYCPEQPVSRAQMAVFLVRTFGLP